MRRMTLSTPIASGACVGAGGSGVQAFPHGLLGKTSPVHFFWGVLIWRLRGSRGDRRRGFLGKRRGLLLR